MPNATNPTTPPTTAAANARRPCRIASQTSTGSTRPVVSFTPSPIPAATPPSSGSIRPAPSSRQAATAGNDAATRSFCAVVDSRANRENVASRQRRARRRPGREAEPARRSVRRDEDRELRQELRERDQAPAVDGDEQEEELLLGERLEGVHPDARRIRIQ